MDSNNEFRDKNKSFVPEAKVAPHFAINFRDIEDPIRQFDGSRSNPVQKWITDLEERYGATS